MYSRPLGPQWQLSCYIGVDINSSQPLPGTMPTEMSIKPEVEGRSFEFLRRALVHKIDDYLSKQNTAKSWQECVFQLQVFKTDKSQNRLLK